MRGLTEEKRKSIVAQNCSEKGRSLRKLAKHEGVSFGAVQNIIKRFGMHNTLKDLPGRGRNVDASKPKLDKKICRSVSKK